jgi:hypothetical protein
MKCKKLGTDEPDASGRWFVYGKDATKFEQAEIWFLRDKVAGIYVDLYPRMKGEAVKFAERLFFLLQAPPINPVTLQIFKDDPPPASVVQSSAEGLANNRHLDLPVDLHYRRPRRAGFAGKYSIDNDGRRGQT